MPDALTSPNAQGPSSIDSPVPAGAALAAPPPSVRLPTMPTPQAGLEPARAPSGGEDLGDFAALPKTAVGGENLGDFGSLPKVADTSEPDATAGGLGDTQPELGMQQLVHLPDGSYGVMEQSSRQVRALNPSEKTAARYAAHALRIGGPTIGAIIGELIPLPGATMGGAVAGGEAVHPAASTLEEIAGEKPHARTNTDRLVEGAGAGVGGLLGKFAPGSSLARDTAIEGGGAAVETAATGAGELAAKEAQGAKDVKESGLPDLPQGTVKTPQVEAGLSKSLDDRVAVVKTNFTSEARTPLGEHVRGFRQDLGKQLRPMADRAAEAARDRQFDVSATEREFAHVLGDNGSRVLDKDGNVQWDKTADSEKPLARIYEKFKKATHPEVSQEGLGTQGNKVPTPGKYTLENQGPPYYDAQGKTTPNKPATFEPGKRTPFKASELPPNATDSAQRGQSIGDMNKWLDTFEDKANFQGLDRTDEQRAFGRIYRSMRLTRDDVSAQVLEEAGQGHLAKALRGSRDRFAKFSDSMDELSGQIEKNPKEAAATLAKKGDLQQAMLLGEALPKQQFLSLGDGIMENIKNVLKESGPKAAAKELDSYGVDVAKAYLGSKDYTAVKTILNGGQALQGRLVEPEAMTGALGGIARKLYQAIRHPGYFTAKHSADMIDAMGMTKLLKSTTGSKVGAATGAATGGTIGDLQGR